MTAVPVTLQIPADTDVRIDRPASALRVGHSALAGITHVVGYMLGQTRVLQVGTDTGGPTNPGHDGVFRYKIWRHPNCLDLYVEIYAHITSDEGDTATVTVTAGNGTSVTHTVPATSAGGNARFAMRVPWGAADSGYNDFLVSCSGVLLRMLRVVDWARHDLSTGDHYCAVGDPTNPRIALREEYCIAEASTGSVLDLLDTLTSCWEDYRAVAGTWSTTTTAGISVGVSDGDKVNPFGAEDDYYWSHTARRKKAETSRPYTVWIDAYSDGSAVFGLVASSHNTGAASDSSSELNDLSASSRTWYALSGVEVDAVDDGQISVQVTGDAAGSGSVIICGVCAVEE